MANPLMTRVEFAEAIRKHLCASDVVVAHSDLVIDFLHTVGEVGVMSVNNALLS